MTITVYSSVLLTILLWISVAEGRVNIYGPSTPLYVEEGSTLSLICNRSTRTDLKWFQRTPNTSWKELLINTTDDSNVVMRNCVKEPSGYVESVLIRTNMSVHDRGSYTCQDDSGKDSFTLWATVLYVYSPGIVANNGTEAVNLLCEIYGFDTNLPEMAAVWQYGDQPISTKDTRLVTMFDPQMGRLRLAINDPSYEDAGGYRCNFSLGTNMGPLVFTGVVHLDASELPASASSSLLHTALLLLVAVSTYLLL